MWKGIKWLSSATQSYIFKLNAAIIMYYRKIFN